MDMQLLDLDQDLVNKMKQPSNKNDPFLLIASIFKSTVLGFGIDEATAENARISFYALKRTRFEET